MYKATFLERALKTKKNSNLKDIKMYTNNYSSTDIVQLNSLKIIRFKFY